MIDQVNLLIHRQRIPLGIGSEYRETDIIGDQPPAMSKKPVGVGGEIRLERCNYRREDAFDAGAFDRG